MGVTKWMHILLTVASLIVIPSNILSAALEMSHQESKNISWPAIYGKVLKKINDLPYDKQKEILQLFESITIGDLEHILIIWHFIESRQDRLLFTFFDEIDISVAVKELLRLLFDEKKQLDEALYTALKENWSKNRTVEKKTNNQSIEKFMGTSMPIAVPHQKNEKITNEASPICISKQSLVKDINLLCQKKALESVKALLQQPHSSIRTLLTFALADKPAIMSELSRILIEHPIHLNMIMLRAIEHEDTNLVQMLLDLKNPQLTVFGYDIALKKGKISLMPYFEGQLATVDQKKTALVQAGTRNKIEAIKRIIQLGIDVKTMEDVISELYASKNDQMARVIYLEHSTLKKVNK